jgi:hypothetical protein
MYRYKKNDVQTYIFINHLSNGSELQLNNNNTEITQTFDKLLQ